LRLKSDIDAAIRTLESCRLRLNDELINRGTPYGRVVIDSVVQRRYHVHALVRVDNVSVGYIFVEYDSFEVVDMYEYDVETTVATITNRSK
jgi:hypothetical protein